MQPPESQDSQTIDRYNEWYVTLKKRYPSMSETQLKETATKVACMNRAERRKFFKVSSPNLPRTMDIP